MRSGAESWYRRTPSSRTRVFLVRFSLNSFTGKRSGRTVAYGVHVLFPPLRLPQDWRMQSPYKVSVLKGQWGPHYKGM